MNAKFRWDYISVWSIVSVAEQTGLCLTWAQAYKTVFMINSAEHGVWTAHKY